MLLHVLLMSSHRWPGDRPSLFSLRHGIVRRDVLIFNPERRGKKKRKRKGLQDARFSRSCAVRQGDTPSQECADFTCGERRGRDSQRAVIGTTFVSTETTPVQQQARRATG